MKTMLKILQLGGEIRIGGLAVIHRYSEGGLSIRMTTSLQGPTVKETVSGLRTLLEWLDQCAKDGGLLNVETKGEP